MKPKKRSLTAAELRDRLNYNPETGAFTWRRTFSNTVKPGDVAGARNVTGYIYICMSGIEYKAHRLAWLHVHGEWPKHYIDHIDGDRANNRIGNLREATKAQNNRNAKKRRDNSSGFKGVGFCPKQNNYRARIMVDKKMIHLGRYRCATAAYFAYLKAAKAHHQDFSKDASL